MNTLQLFLEALRSIDQEVPKELVRLSLQEQMMDVQMANNILGVVNKELDVQKSRRNVSINNINDL